MSIHTARPLYRNSERLEPATANGNRYWNPACRPSDDLSSYPPADSFEADATAYATACAYDQSRVFTGDETSQQATAEQDRVNSIIEQGFPATRRFGCILPAGSSKKWLAICAIPRHLLGKGGIDYAIPCLSLVCQDDDLALAKKLVADGLALISSTDKQIAPRPIVVAEGLSRDPLTHSPYCTPGDRGNVVSSQPAYSR